MSGEDPALGAALVGPIVEGIQSNGVMANAKHFLNNNQETERMRSTSAVSERAQWELYLPPFAAAVDAGVASLMCRRVSWCAVRFSFPSFLASG